MDTTEAAEKLGTTPRVLRQFLRSPYSTFVAVGSGARYDFTERDLPTLQNRFNAWAGAGKPKPEGTKRPPARKAKSVTQSEKDRAEWAEEGSLTLPDIRDPRVRARVKADAQAAEERLTLLLLAKGLHITQLGDRKAS